MLLVNDNGTKILRRLVDGEFKFGDLVNLVGCVAQPGVVVKVKDNEVCVLWEDSIERMFIESWFEPWELKHVV